MTPPVAKRTAVGDHRTRYGKQAELELDTVEKYPHLACGRRRSKLDYIVPVRRYSGGISEEEPATTAIGRCSDPSFGIHSGSARSF